METSSSSAGMLPILVGGLAGHIFWSGSGRFVGGCAGFVRLNRAERRYSGGCVGRVYELGERRFVGGCAGFAWRDAYHTQPRGRVDRRTHREVPTRWGEEALAAAGA